MRKSKISGLGDYGVFIDDVSLAEMSDNDWINLQVGFLEAHHFHTAFGKNNLQPKKQENLLRIKASVPRKS